MGPFVARWCDRRESPNRNSRVDLDPDQHDQFGIPLSRTSAWLDEFDIGRLRFMAAKSRELWPQAVRKKFSRVIQVGIGSALPTSLAPAVWEPIPPSQWSMLTVATTAGAICGSRTRVFFPRPAAAKRHLSPFTRCRCARRKKLERMTKTMTERAMLNHRGLIFRRCFASLLRSPAGVTGPLSRASDGYPRAALPVQLTKPQLTLQPR